MASAKTGTLYRGREGMWSWVAHRISGMLLFLFLVVHVLDTALVRVSPEAYNAVIGHYHSLIFGIGELGLVGALLFHALNGLRIIAVDFFASGTRYQRQLLWVAIGVWAILMIGFSIRHIPNILGA